MRLSFLPALLVLSSSGAVCAAEFLPLQDGNSWTYRAADGSHQFTIRAGTPVIIGERTWYPLTGYAQQRVLARYEADRPVTLYEPTLGEVL